MNTKLRKRYILFDLDGTLFDSAPGITNSLMFALDKYNIKVSDRKELYVFIGPPVWDSFQKYYGFSKEQAAEATRYYRSYFQEKGIFENEIYNGIIELLTKLNVAGKTLIVATSKPIVFANRILEHAGIDKYFSYVAGSELDGTRIDKAEVIAHALQECDIANKNDAIMIGDREHDILGAKKNGISSIGVLYGYGNIEELQEAHADYVVNDTMEIEQLLC